jgi:EF hand domain-containing protein
MLPAVGLLSSGLDALQSLISSKSSSSSSSQSTGFINPFDQTGSTGQAATSQSGFGSPDYARISPQTMSALIDAQSQSGTSASTSSKKDALKDLFSLIDGNGDGQISKDEFEQALGAGGTNIAQADDVFSKLDKDGDGTVSLDELKSALQGGRHGHHHHHVASADSSSSSSGATGSSSDPLQQALAAYSASSALTSAGDSSASGDDGSQKPQLRQGGLTLVQLPPTATTRISTEGLGNLMDGAAFSQRVFG